MMKKIDPVIVLSTGRCGSTMVSDMMNLHPRILSLSEFFIPLGSSAFSKANPDGETMWKAYSRQTPSLHSMLEDGKIVSEGLYPFGAAGARYSPGNIPPILCVTLPHLTSSFEALFDELEPVVRARPKGPLADHYRFLFEWLCDRFKKDLWLERSGGSLMKAGKLIRLFPEARIIHVFRDGRDTAMSMSRHHNFRVLLAMIKKARKMGVNFVKGFSSPKLEPFLPMSEKWLFKLFDIEALKKQEFSLEEFGELWSRMILAGQECFAQLPSDRFMSFRFEDLQERPGEELRRLIEFIDPDLLDDPWLDEVEKMPRASSPRYLKLEPDERRRLTRACAPGLELLGYPLT